MSHESEAIVINHSRSTGTARLVLWGIASHDGDGGAWPSIARLSRYANVTERNVQKAIRQLVQLGELHVYPQAGGTAHTQAHMRPNRYEITLACPIHCDGTKNHKLRDLPRAQSSLWIEGVSEATPGVGGDTRGVSEATPGGVSEATPELPKELTMNTLVLPEVTTDRARPCGVCDLDAEECHRRAATNGHRYQPAGA